MARNKKDESVLDRDLPDDEVFEGTEAERERREERDRAKRVIRQAVAGDIQDAAAQLRKEFTEGMRPKSERELREEEILNTLAQLGKERASEQSIEFGDQMILPKEFKGNLPGAIRFLEDYHEAEETPTEFTKTFMRRPWDGAAATFNALQKLFGTTGMQKSVIVPFFGTQRPEMKTIQSGWKETMEIPWGRVAFPLIEANLDFGSTKHRTYGQLFRLTVTCPKKHAAKVAGMFIAIERECEENSIYKGKAIDGQANPEFIDVNAVDPRKIVYSNQTLEDLQANLWSPIRRAEVQRALGASLKRAVLVFGVYGTGKTLTLLRTLQVATNSTWTSIMVRPGRDDLDQVMQTARLYQPCVLVVEDVDTVTSQSGEEDSVRRLFDLFDGIQSKNTELIVVLTTNHPDRIHKAMWRPGRFDAVIELGGLDQDGIETLTRVLLPESMLSDTLDFAEMYGAMAGYSPAFCKEVIERALRYAISRLELEVDPEMDPVEFKNAVNNLVLVTDDFVGAAHGLRPQYDRMGEAEEGVSKDPLSISTARALADNAVLIPTDDNEESGRFRFALVGEAGNGTSEE